jgi:hypothetical protein
MIGQIQAMGMPYFATLLYILPGGSLFGTPDRTELCDLK